jgi:parallel beta-helix repeat protein
MMKLRRNENVTRLRARGPSLLVCIFVLLVSSLVVGPGNDVEAGKAVSGIIPVDTIWTQLDSPIWVEGHLGIPLGVDLTIEPGVEIRFNGNYTIWVDGNFTSLGTPANGINFKSNGTVPGYKDWFKIRVNATSMFEVSHTDFQNAFTAVELMGRDGDTFSNTSFSNSFIGIAALWSSSVSVTNSSFSDVHRGLKLTNHSNVVRGSSFTGGRIAADISCNDVAGYCIDNVVEKNDFSDMEGGIYLRSEGPLAEVSRNKVRNNTFLDVDAPVAISNLLGVSEKNVVENNSMMNGAYGIFLRNSENNTVLENEITNFKEGIGLYGAEDNLVARNVVTRGIDGIVVRDTTRGNEIIFNNIVSFAGCGIALVQDSSGNLIHHNNLLDSGYNGCDAGTGNMWDNGYPSGGNFWSDYYGLDAFNGPNQDIPGPDAIGDTPHNARGNGRDNYPLLGMPSGNIPITKLDIALTGWDFENVTISWNLTWPHGNVSQNLTRFDVFRSDVLSVSRSGYQLLASISNDTFEYTDFKAGEGNSSNYFYYVCSVNMTNVSYCSLDQVGKFTRSLEAGWNLASIPLIQKDWRTAKVLQTTTFDRVWTYDAKDSGDHWKEHSLVKMYNDLPTMDVFKGYWVHVTTDCNLTVVGKVPIVTRIQHTAGWNLLGYPSFTNRTIELALDGKFWELVEGFDNTSSPYHLRQLSELDLMTAGEGYWIYFSTGGVWTVRN